jgi:hypothetical protein
MDQTKRLLLIGTSLVGLVVVAVWLVGGGADGTPDDQPGGVASGDVAATSTSDISNEMAPVSNDEDLGATEDPETPTEEESAALAGRSEGSDEPALTTKELSMEACEQFEDGHTVADFAKWFEEQFQGDESERADVFRAVLTQALTDECPEVIPDS